MITVAFYVQDFWLLLIASNKESVFTLLEFLNIINTYAQLDICTPASLSRLRIFLSPRKPLTMCYKPKS